MSTLLGIVAAPWFRYAALAGAVLALIAGGILHHRSTYEAGREAGRSELINDVQQKTIETMDAARISKERTDEEVRRTPYDDRADGLR